MFETMRKHKFAWEEFKIWFYNQDGGVYCEFLHCPNRFKLYSMPFFFDEKGIHIQGKKLVIRNEIRKWEYIVEYQVGCLTEYKWTDRFDNRKQALIHASEIAFDILSKQI